MSRIGNAIISLPKGVDVQLEKTQVTVKGPKGTLKQAIEPGFSLNPAEDGGLQLVRPSETKRHKAMHGLYRALIFNMVKGVADGYKLTLELVGVGYRAEVKGQNIEMTLGYSHPILFVLPAEVKAEAIVVKGANPKLVLTGIDKQLLGQVAAKIRSLRKPEPYKGKGVKYEGEVLRRKAGKASGKGKK